MRQAHRCDWMPPKDLLHDGVDVPQLLAVLKAGEPIGADDAVDFLLRLALDVGVEGHGEEEACYGGDGLEEIKTVGLLGEINEVVFQVEDEEEELTVSAPPV